MVDNETPDDAGAEDCEWCSGWEHATIAAGIEHKTKGWDPERRDIAEVPHGYGYIGGLCDGCRRWLDFREADAAYDEATSEQEERIAVARAVRESIENALSRPEEAGYDDIAAMFIGQIRQSLEHAHGHAEEWEQEEESATPLSNRTAHELRDLAESLGIDPGGLEELAEHWSRRPMA